LRRLGLYHCTLSANLSWRTGTARQGLTIRGVKKWLINTFSERNLGNPNATRQKRRAELLLSKVTSAKHTIFISQNDTPEEERASVTEKRLEIARDLSVSLAVNGVRRTAEGPEKVAGVSRDKWELLVKSRNRSVRR